MWSRTAHAPRLCLPMFLSAPRTSSERSRRWLSRDGLSRPVSVARPGNACHFPADLPFPEQGGGGAPSIAGGGAGVSFSSPSPKRLRSVPPIKRRWPVSHNASRFPNRPHIPAEILLFRNHATQFCSSPCSRPVGSKAAPGGLSRKPYCYVEQDSARPSSLLPQCFSRHREPRPRGADGGFPAMDSLARNR